MVEKIRSFWHDQIPAWLALAVTIIGSAVGLAFYLGQQQQSILDRLNSVEKQVRDMQQYLRTHSTARDDLPPFSENDPPQLSTNPRTN